MFQASAGDHIRISFNTFSLEEGDCGYDSLQITGGLSDKDGDYDNKFCGLTAPEDLVIAGTDVSIYFQ